MIPDTSITRPALRTIVQVVQQWNRVCAVYTVINILWRGHEWRPKDYWELYCAAETIFLFFLVWYASYIQRPTPHPPKLSSEERNILFHKALERIHDPVKFLRGWHNGADLADIGVQELKRFLIWSFWDGRTEDVDSKELTSYTDKLQSLIPNFKLKDGFGRARSLCLTVDEFHIDLRTLAWYAVVMVADTLCFAIFTLWGYTYYHRSTTTMSSFPPRPAGLLSPAKSPSEKVSYWMTRPHTSKTRLPIVFYHGIGIGLIMYLAFFRELDRALNKNADPDDQVGILLIEMPQISSRISGPMLRRDSLIEEWTMILDYHGFHRFVLVGHSYGTFLSTYVLTSPLAQRVSATMLVDPVSILLHMPDVVYNFTARRPVRANEWGLWFFASIDPGVAYTLSRHCFWHEMTLWDDQIRDLVVNKKSRFTISLAADDLIIDAENIGKHLTREFNSEDIPTTCSRGDAPEQSWTKDSAETWKQRPWQGEGVDVLWWPGFDHGLVFHQKAARKGLVDVLTKYVQGA